MNLALNLARQGLFTTTANPRVACIIVKNNVVIGRGYHRRVGERHAEVFALREAGKDAKNATAYVTLEPCSHYGKNPPCADALIHAGVKEVIVCNKDPNPLVAGKGIQKLADAGIRVHVGVKHNKGLRLNRGFFHRMQTGLPWLKRLHRNKTNKIRYWRARSQATLVHVNDLDIDLFVSHHKLRSKHQHLPHDFDNKQPTLVILDRLFSINPDNTIFNTPGTVIIVTNVENPEKAMRFKGKTADIIPLQKKQAPHTDLDQILRYMGSIETNELLVLLSPSLVTDLPEINA